MSSDKCKPIKDVVVVMYYLPKVIPKTCLLTVKKKILTEKFFCCFIIYHSKAYSLLCVMSVSYLTSNAHGTCNTHFF